jgi:hypothetical protein
MATSFDGGKTWIPTGKLERDYLEKQSIKKLLWFIGMKSRSIKDCKIKIVDMLEGINFDPR